MASWWYRNFHATQILTPAPPTHANTTHANVVQANTTRANTACVTRNLNDRFKRALVWNACLKQTCACALFHVEHCVNVWWNVTLYFVHALPTSVEHSVEHHTAYHCQVTSVPHDACGTFRTVIQPGHLRLHNPRLGSDWKFPTHLLDSEKLKLDGFDYSCVFLTL